MLETKYVDDNFKTLVTVLAILVIENPQNFVGLSVGCPQSEHYVFSNLDYGLSQMILMVTIMINHDLKVHFDLKKNLESARKPLESQAHAWPFENKTTLHTAP